ncbi:MAG: nucleotidyltransferase domain-containing protein [Candidatus Omnitrophica bacterium]|nr:nucleotidyltransferase domain-containing protein [Candidatus Omnitrophota bacterium]
MIDLKPEYLDEIKRILSSLASDCEVRVFGSRISGRARSYSDLDIVLMGPKEIDWRRIEAIKQAFSESEIPFLVDVVDWHAISDEFKKVIEKHYEVLSV